MTAAQPLVWFNLLPLWRKQVSVWGLRMRAITADRLLYLWLHRAGVIGKEERVFIESRYARACVPSMWEPIWDSIPLLARCAGPSGHVIALEPDPDLFAALRSNCRDNGADNMELLNVAAGSKPGTLTLSRNLVNAGDNRSRLSLATLWSASSKLAPPIDNIAGGRTVDLSDRRAGMGERKSSRG